MVRFGLIGTNFISHTFMEAAKVIPEFELAAVYSRSEETGRAFAEKYGVEKVYTSLEELGGDPDIDAVYIASPNSLHAPQSIRMMGYQKHVLCEKPVASDLKEWEAMLEAAKKNNVIVLEAMRPVFDPGFEKIKELLPRLGTIRKVSFEFSKYSSRYDEVKAGNIMNAFNPALSNAAVMDLGCYCIHPMVALFGMPESISAQSIFLPNGMECLGTMVAEYPGMQAVIQYSKISDCFVPNQIQGEKGSIIFHGISVLDKIELRIGREDSESFVFEKPTNNMYYETRRFIEMIGAGERGKEEAALWNGYSTMQMKVLDEVRRCAGIEFK